MIKWKHVSSIFYMQIELTKGTFVFLIHLYSVWKILENHFFFQSRLLYYLCHSFFYSYRWLRTLLTVRREVSERSYFCEVRLRGCMLVFQASPDGYPHVPLWDIRNTSNRRSGQDNKRQRSVSGPASLNGRHNTKLVDQCQQRGISC